MLSAFCFLLSAVSSCSFNPNYQGKGTAFLQGEWKQDSIDREKQLVNYSLYNFSFSCDSFYLHMESFSKVNSGSDTCMNSGHWHEYIKGTYEQKTDTLHLSGFFCNRDYSLKSVGGCFRSGVYEENFKIISKTDSAINLLPFNGFMALKLNLIKRIICVPKPL